MKEKILKTKKKVSIIKTMKTPITIKNNKESKKEEEK
jgi:hypothetical protein